MKRVIKPAIKKRDGKVESKDLPAHHRDIARMDRRLGGDGRGKRGFVDSEGEFVGRQRAKKIAKRAGQACVRGRRGLHSEDLI